MDLRRPALVVVPDLLGCLLREGNVALPLMEGSAHEGHAAAGHAVQRLTPLTEVMVELGGRLYVYLRRGLHHCADIVCQALGATPAARLRAGEPSRSTYQRHTKMVAQ